MYLTVAVALDSTRGFDERYWGIRAALPCG
jgi:hypothetical protein